ncbi:MAG: gluconate 2-dehydrogenase subunit 3 family protein [Acidobacteria bacterium]|nr:gluconate 2-dehydrogenase subunit 3 family protein [Acidobacteriota bacterium]
MNRRDLLKIGAGAAAVPVIAPAQQPAAADGWRPAVFSEQQNAAVIALTDRIILATETAGAKAAGVNRYLDKFLSVSPEAERRRFLEGLDALDERCRREQGRPFAELSGAQEDAILQSMAEAPETDAGHRFFRMAKSMTSQIYYNTEAGFRELNQGGVPKTFACEHPVHE